MEREREGEEVVCQYSPCRGVGGPGERRGTSTPVHSDMPPPVQMNDGG